MRLLPDNLRFVVRSLSRNRAFLITAIVSLALGIGANSALFTIANQMLLRTLPVKQPRQLVLFNWRGQFIGGTSRGWQDTFSYPTYADLRQANPDVFTGIAARYQNTVDLGDKGSPQRAVAELVSGNYFQVLGVTAAFGRTLTPEDDKLKAAEPYVVLSYEYWRRRFGGDPSILNRVIDLNGHPVTVVGVAQRGFAGFESMSPSDIFVPMMMKPVVTPTWDDLSRRNSIWLKIFARLKPGVAPKAAEAAIAIPFHNTLENDLQANSRDRDFSRRYLRDTLVLTDASKGFDSMQRQFAKPLYVLLAMAAALLLITCVNVAGLLITRASSRQREIAIRLSLGATRASLVRLIMIESFCVAALSGALGLALSYWLSALLVRMLPFQNIAVALQTTPDWRVLAFTGGLSLLTAFLFGLIPAFEATRPDVAPTLKNESASVSLGARQTQLRRGLVAAQVALSLLLLAAAGLFARSLHKLMTVNSGMSVDRVLTFAIDPSLHKYTPQRSRRLFLEFQDGLRHLPGVISASAVSFAVLADNSWQNTVHVEGYRPRPQEDMNPGWNQMLPAFFSTMGVPLIAGRDFTDRDIASSPKVVIVNETFAKRYVPHGRPLGLHLGWGGLGPLEYEIVGVVKDIKGADLKEQPKPWTYTAALQDEKPSEMTFYIRTARDPLSIAQAARSVLHKLDASLPMVDVKTVERQIDETHFIDRLFAWLSSAFGMLATLLASIGLYGITAFAVTRRTREIGIRVALGAERGNVLRLIMREVLLLTIAGIVIGLPAALALGKLAGSELYGLKPDDPAVLTVVVVVILGVSLLAGYLPARRATRIDPMQVLRYE